MHGNQTNGIYQDRYRKATVSSLGDMTRLYANKNIWAVLKQEMKNGNITKTFPRADIWAGCQFFKTIVNDSSVVIQYGGSCADRLHMREENANEFEWVHSEKQNPQRQAKMLLQKVKCFWRINSGKMAEIRQPQFGTLESTLFQRQTPNLFISNSREHGYTIGEIMAGIFHSQISFNEHASLKKNQRRKKATWKRTTFITLLGRPWVNVFRHAPRENSTRSHVLRLLLRSQGPWKLQIWLPDTRHVLEAVFSLPCLIMALLVTDISPVTLGRHTELFHQPVSRLASRTLKKNHSTNTCGSSR